MGRPVWQAPSVLGVLEPVGLVWRPPQQQQSVAILSIHVIICCRGVACSGKVRSSGRVMQQHSCSRSQRASSTSFWSSCSARRASPPASASPSSPAQPRSRSRAGSTRARAAAVTRGTSAARNDGSSPCTAPSRRARRGASAPFQPARVSPAAAPRWQRWPMGAVGPHSPAIGPRGRHSAPKGAENATGERQAGHARPRGPGRLFKYKQVSSKS